MASNYNEEDVEDQQTIPEDNSTYNQLWQDALDVDEEVQRILQEHSMPINHDELEHAEEAQEYDNGMQWVILFFFFKSDFRVRSTVIERNVFCVIFFSPSSWLFYR